MPREGTKSGKGSKSSKTARVLSLLTDPNSVEKERDRIIPTNGTPAPRPGTTTQLAMNANTQSQIRSALEQELSGTKDMAPPPADEISEPADVEEISPETAETATQSWPPAPTQPAVESWQPANEFWQPAKAQNATQPAVQSWQPAAAQHAPQPAAQSWQPAATQNAPQPAVESWQPAAAQDAPQPAATQDAPEPDFEPWQPAPIEATPEEPAPAPAEAWQPAPPAEPSSAQSSISDQAFPPQPAPQTPSAPAAVEALPAVEIPTAQTEPVSLTKAPADTQEIGTEAVAEAVEEVVEEEDDSDDPTRNEFICFNVTEALVEDKAEKYIKLFGVCNCPRCRIDVISLALTNLPAKYVVTRRKDIIPRLSVYESKYNTAVITQVMSACRRVMVKPHHER